MAFSEKLRYGANQLAIIQHPKELPPQVPGLLNHRNRQWYVSNKRHT
jgi:hypothetical protein